MLNLDSIRKKLESKSVSELRKLIEKLTKAISGNFDTINQLRQRQEDARESFIECYRLIHRSRWIIGKRKGLHCPALLQRQEISLRRGRKLFKHRMNLLKYTCGCKTNPDFKTSFNFFHKCSFCKLNKKEAYNNMVFKGVFQ